MTAVVERSTTSATVHRATARLPYKPESVGAARRLIRDKLTEWGLVDLVDAAELIVSELATNAVETGCQRHMTVVVSRVNAGTVRISVRDGSRSLPCLVDAGPDATSGRGIGIVHHLTDGHWGVTPDPFGKTVHPELRMRSPSDGTALETPPEISA